MRKETAHRSPNEAEAAITVAHLLHPHEHFSHPDDVLRAAHLGVDDKRAILASWASDQYAVESIPALRHYPGAERAVTYDDILAALKALDGDQPSSLQTVDGPGARRLDLRGMARLRRRYRAPSPGG